MVIVENIRRERLIKLAAARWRELVRAGEASPSVLEGLRGMGLWGTKDSVSREVRGVERGTRLLSRINNIEHRRASGTNPLTSVAFRGESRPEIMPNPDHVGERFYAARGRLSERLAERSVASATVGDMKEYERLMRIPSNLPSLYNLPKAGRVPEYIPAPGPVHLMRVVRVVPKRGAPAQNALIRRHEVDEHLVAGLPTGVSMNPRFGGHESPEVIAREAGHANFLFPDQANNPLNRLHVRGKEMAAVRRAQAASLPPALSQELPREQYAGWAKLHNQARRDRQPLQQATYKKFHGTYYGMSKKQRGKFDQAAAAQYGYQPLTAQERAQGYR